MPERFRYEPWSARIAPGEQPTGPSSSCGAGGGEQYNQGLQLWQSWFEAAKISVPSIKPNTSLEVTVEFTADHGGQAWFKIACSDTLNENTNWLLLERALGDRSVNFMAGNPNICAWEMGSGCRSISWWVPPTFSCPTGRAVGRWVWKVGNTCNDADNLGIDTETFSMEEWKSVTGNGSPKCVGSYPEHFVSCFVLRVDGAGLVPVPNPTPMPTIHPRSEPEATPFPSPAKTGPTLAPTQFLPPRATPAPTPMLSMVTPAPAPPTGICVPTNEGLFNNPAVYRPWCEAASIVCPAPICRRTSAVQR